MTSQVILTGQVIMTSKVIITSQMSKPSQVIMTGEVIMTSQVIKNIQFFITSQVTKASQVNARQDESCCQICEEKLHNDIWGLVHGDSMHFGYCKICSNRLKNSTSPKCPNCCADIETVIRVYN